MTEAATPAEPPIGSHVQQTGTIHRWTRLDNGWWSCACDVNDCVQWDWDSVLDDIGSAPYVIEAAVPDLNAHLEAS